MKRTIAGPLVALLFCLAFSHPAKADFERAHWQFLKKIKVPQLVESEYAFFQVDAETYDGSLGELQSLRIIDADSREAPYQLVTKRGSEQRKEFVPKILNNSYLPGEHNSFVLDIGEEPPTINELTIMTASKNFTRLVSVEGSDNQADWNLLVDEAYIYDFSREVRSKYMRVVFPPSNFRYLRVKVFDDGSGSLEITGARAFRVTKEEARTERWPLSILEITENEEDRTTEVILDAGHRGLPIREIEVDVISRNYHRNVHVYSGEDRENWVPLGQGVIFNYDLAHFKKTGNLLSFRENATGRYFKLTVHNYDDQPIEIAGASGIGLVRRVIFPLRWGQSYKLYCGNRKATAPRYDLARRMPYIETERLPHLTLGLLQSNPDYVVTKPVRPWSEEHSYLLWVVMAAVIVVLALLIFNLLRKTPPGEARK